MLGLLHVAGLFLWTAMNQLERADFFSRVAILDLLVRARRLAATGYTRLDMILSCGNLGLHPIR